MKRLKLFAIVIIVIIAITLLMRDNSGPVSASAEIEISTPIKEVWKLQVDIKNWPKWNKDIEKMDMQGPLAPGTKFIWSVGGITITSEIQEVVPHKRIVWSGQTFGIDAVHIWVFEEKGDETHVYTEETFTGPLAWLFPGMMRNTIKDALDKGVNLLKQQAELQSQ